VLIVGTSDGYVKLVNQDDLSIKGSFKVHKMAVTSAVMDTQKQVLITGSIDYTFTVLTHN